MSACACLSPSPSFVCARALSRSRALPSLSLSLTHTASALPLHVHVMLSHAHMKRYRCHRYGLMGANGTGKSTLLKFVAAKPCRLPVSEDLDILLVEQEMSVR